MSDLSFVKKQLCMKTVDMYSVVNQLDHIKAERDEWYAVQHGYQLATAGGQHSQSFSLEKSSIIKPLKAGETTIPKV
jgi:hypothetical protein